MSVRVRALGPALVVALLALAGCGGGSASPSQTQSPGSPAVSASPSSTPASTELTIVVDDGSGQQTTWRLTCDPAGGDHPDPEAACAILAAHGERALPPTPKDMVCTQQYGGPETASITGTWRGNPVTSTFSRTDGCEISRWTLMQGLLPRAGG